MARLRRVIGKSVALLETGPYGDPESLDVDAVERGLRAQAVETERRAGFLARTAQARADATRSNLGIMDRLATRFGRPTQIAAELAQLDQVAAECAAKFRTEGVAMERSLHDVRRRAIEICALRSRARAFWQAQPHIILAMQELKLDRVALAAVEDGDEAMAELVAGYGIHASRRMLEAGLEAELASPALGRRTTQPSTSHSPSLPWLTTTRCQRTA